MYVQGFEGVNVLNLPENKNLTRQKKSTFLIASYSKHESESHILISTWNLIKQKSIRRKAMIWEGIQSGQIEKKTAV